jgi:hypothetical protein
LGKIFNVPVALISDIIRLAPLIGRIETITAPVCYLKTRPPKIAQFFLSANCICSRDFMPIAIDCGASEMSALRPIADMDEIAVEGALVDQFYRHA